MADNIEQVFGIDASQALAALSQLDSAFQNMGSRLNTLSGQIGQFNSTAGATVSALKTLGSSFTSNLGQASQATQRLTVSWGLLSRVVTVQAIVRGLNELRVGFKEATTSAIEFQTRVAEVGTIAGGALGNNDNIAKQARALSDKIGVDLKDVVKSQYQSISFGLGDNTPKFLQTASLFSKGSVTDLADSTKLLAGTLKSFELDASQADHVASVFFETIKDGAVTGTSLAGNFGKIAPLSRELGISLEETAAAFSTLTQRGISASESATAIRGSINALLKPTAEMTTLLHQLGFENGQAAISTLGFGKTLHTILDSTHGQADVLSKLVPNVRGLAGVLGGIGGADYTSKLTAVKDVSDGLSRSKGLEVLGTEAQSVSRQLNELHNILTVDLGGSILRAISDVTNLTGGLDNLKGVASAVGPAVLGVGVGILGLKGAALSSSLEVAGLSRALGALALIPVAQGLGASIGHLIDDKLSSKAAQALQERQQAAQKDLDNFRDAQSAKIKAENDTDDKRVQAINNALRGISGVYLREVETAKSANESIVSDANRTADELARIHAKYAGAAGAAAEKSREIFQQSGNRVSDLQQLQSDRNFQRANSGRSANSQGAALLARSLQEAQEAASRLTTAGRTGNHAGIEQAQKLFAHAQHGGEQAQSIAERTGNRQAEASAAAVLKKITETQISAEQTLQRLQQSRAQGLSKEATRQEEIAKTIRGQAKVLEDNSSLFDKSGHVYSPEQQAQRRKRTSRALSNINHFGSLPDHAAALGLDAFATEHHRQLTTLPGQLQSRTEAGLTNVSQHLSSSFAKYKANSPIDIDALAKAVGHSLTSPSQVTGATREVQNHAATLRSQIAAGQVSGREANQIGGQIGVIRRGIDARANVRSTFPGAEGDSLRKDFNSVLKEFDAARKHPTKNNVDTVFKHGSALNDRAQGSLTGRLAFGGSLEQLAKGTGLLGQQAQAQTKSAGVPQLQQQLQGLTSVLGNIKSVDVSTSFKSAASSAQSLSSALSGAAGVVQALSAAASGSGGGDSGGGDDQPRQLPEHAFGGMVRKYLATGGPSGTDTVPAMLSPGEYIVNRNSTAKFYSQLQAINGNKMPAGRGPTSIDNSQSFGDININGAANPKATAREVVNQIRREQRRGSAYPVNQNLS